MLKDGRRKVDAVTEQVRNWLSDCCKDLEDICEQAYWWCNGLGTSWFNSSWFNSVPVGPVGLHEAYLAMDEESYEAYWLGGFIPCWEDSFPKARRDEDRCRNIKFKLCSNRREHRSSRLRRLAKADRKTLLLSVPPSSLQGASDRSSMKRLSYNLKVLGKHGGRRKSGEARFDAEDLSSSSDDDVVCQHPCQSITSMAHGPCA